MYDIIVIGGGVAGMSAAISAAEHGAHVAMITKKILGGKLLQNIQNGCGEQFFGEDLTGPEFAAGLTSRLRESGVRVIKNAEATEVSSDLKITLRRASKISEMKAKSIILATGSKESQQYEQQKQPIKGVLTAIEAQRLINIEGKKPGKKAIIYGSDELALAVARSLTLEGTKVVCVCEKEQEAQAMPKYIVECLEEFDIPLYTGVKLSTIGEPLEGINISSSDEKKFVECDTLVLSPSLLPDDSLTKALGITIDEKTCGASVSEDFQSSADGVFVIGSALHSHNSIDDAAFEGAAAGKSAADFVKSKAKRREGLKVIAGNGIKYALPQSTLARAETKIFFRPEQFRKSVRLNVMSGENLIYAKRYPALLPGMLESIEINLENSYSDITLSLEAQ